MKINFGKISTYFYNSSILKRIFSLQKSIFAYSTSSLIDLLTIALTSKIFSLLVETKYSRNIVPFVLIFILAVLLRTYFVFILRQYSFFKIFEKKNEDELNIVKKFVQYRVYASDTDEESIQSFKESIINSTVEATRNFDVPIVAVIAESLFAIGGIFFLLKYLGIRLFIFNFPLFLGLLIISRSIAKKLHRLGKKLLLDTEKRLVSIDNISEISMEISALNFSDPFINYFDKSNKPYNKSLNTLFVNTNRLQIIIEAISLLIILLSMITIILGFTKTSIVESASSLAILTRMVPSITRCIAYFSQLQFGLAPVQKLARMRDNNYFGK